MGNLDKVRQGEAKRRTTRSRPSLEWLEHRVTPSTFHVNTLLDTDAVSLKTGKDASGHISLRSAIEAADAKPNADTIILPAGTFKLTISPTGNDDASTGDLDIDGSVTIKGAGAGLTIVDGNNLDRLFDILGGTVAISNVTIQHGLAAAAGGGILNEGGKVTLTDVDVENNVAMGQTLRRGLDVTATNAVGTAGGAGSVGLDAEGGGIMNQSGSLTLKDCFITSNQAVGGAGGAGGNGTDGIGANGSAGGNGQAGTGGAGGAGGNGGNGFGGGVFNETGARLTLIGADISQNAADGGNGGGGGRGGVGGGGIGGNDQGQGAGSGGSGTGGIGGSAGAGGQGAGGGLYNLGSVTMSGAPTTFTSNDATGGPGGAGGFGFNGEGEFAGNGTSSRAGGAGGAGQGGSGGSGGQGGDGLGGGIFNGPGATVSGPTLLLSSNVAAGDAGGVGGPGLPGSSGQGGSSQGGASGNGGVAFGGAGGAGGEGGFGEGGGLFNSETAVVSIMPAKKTAQPVASEIQSNHADGGAGGTGGNAGRAQAQSAGNSTSAGASFGGAAFGAAAGAGGPGRNGLGGGIFNGGTVTFSGVTVNFLNNQAKGGEGGSGGDAGAALGGNGGNGQTGGRGGNASAANGGNGGQSGGSVGGGIDVQFGGTLTLNPRQGAEKRSKQSSATDSITGNQAFEASNGAGGQAGSATAGSGGTPGGASGDIVPGSNGSTSTFEEGLGGGVATFGTTTASNTNITGNLASTGDDDVDGTINT